MTTAVTDKQAPHVLAITRLFYACVVIIECVDHERLAETAEVEYLISVDASLTIQAVCYEISCPRLDRQKKTVHGSVGNESPILAPNAASI